MLDLKSKLSLLLIAQQASIWTWFFVFVLLLVVHMKVKRLIHLSEWEMHHNCCSLSSLNYLLLAQAQVNNTLPVYRCDQPCHLNHWLTKERGNPQFADSVSRELANSSWVEKGTSGKRGSQQGQGKGVLPHSLVSNCPLWEGGLEPAGAVLVSQ